MVINKEDIKKILEIAANAPSGSNSQPWKFKVKDNQILQGLGELVGGEKGKSGIFTNVSA